jgi:iron(III) transport system ATP-binding protein
MIAGFEEPTKGQIWFGDKRVDRLAPNLRDTAMVFQSYAIFPHLNVHENVAFGLRMKRLPKAKVEEQVTNVLELVGLGHLGHRQPSQLSGGQQQRVALARSIVMEPRLLLFDEPLSNLDAKLREQMRLEIRDLQQRLGITSVYVTHDQTEAMAMSDLVVVMNAGRVEQVGSPLEIYARPVNRFVADFIGNANFVDASVVDEGTVRIGTAELPLTEPTAAARGSDVTVVVRPESLALAPATAPAAPEEHALLGRVTRDTVLGSHAE